LTSPRPRRAWREEALQALAPDTAGAEVKAGGAGASFGSWREGTPISGSPQEPEVNGGVGALVQATGADDADGGVVGRELLVLLERLAKGV